MPFFTTTHQVDVIRALLHRGANADKLDRCGKSADYENHVEAVQISMQILKEVAPATATNEELVEKES